MSELVEPARGTPCRRFRRRRQGVTIRLFLTRSALEVPPGARCLRVRVSPGSRTPYRIVRCPGGGRRRLRPRRRVTEPPSAARRAGWVVASCSARGRSLPGSRKGSASGQTEWISCPDCGEGCGQRLGQIACFEDRDPRMRAERREVIGAAPGASRPRRPRGPTPPRPLKPSANGHQPTAGGRSLWRQG